MGDQKVAFEYDEHALRIFTKAVLTDLEALEAMFVTGMMEEGVQRIGAEQEMFLVDSAMRPAPIAMDILGSANEERLTTEIGKFNLEANLTPLEFEGHCLRETESEINELLGIVDREAGKYGGNALLVGILPTLNESDLVHENMTPKPRYFELDRVLTHLSGGTRHIHIKGLDELHMIQHSALTETCNTSFQVHFQPGTDDFVRYYNWAQAISGVVLAPAVNSPLLFGHRLWHETRLALFKHATDTRSETHQARSQQTRVNFGNDWVRHSMLEVFHEDVARFRIILTQDVEEDSMDVLRAGGVPKLSAWRMHNGTIWRWNRACYGIVDGKPGLRIEVRYLPAGPTVADQMANAAFFLGLMSSLPNKYGDVTDMMSFADAKNNFFSAARFGLRSQMVWFGGETYRTKRLILEELLPLAHEGLINAGIDQADINRYLGILQKRVESEMTGAQWMLDSMDAMDPVAKKVVKIRTLTSAILENQRGDKQVADWEMPVIPQNSEWLDNYQTVEQFMSKDLFTVRPEDVIDLAASLMSWKHVRHVPVEDDTGILVGLISYRDLLELIPRIQKESEIIVRDVMKKDLLTVKPDTPTLDALYIMRSKGVGCLPVTMDSKLVGLITAHDFLTVSTRLLEERLKDKPL